MSVRKLKNSSVSTDVRAGGGAGSGKPTIERTCAGVSVPSDRLVRAQPVHRALELAHVRELHARQLFDHAGRERDLSLVALVAQDRDARLEVRRADVDDQPAAQAADQPLVHVGDLRRRTIARHDDLAAAALQRVEQAQQLALRLAAAGEELHVVDQQHVDAAVALLEPLHLAGGDGRVQLLDEILQRHVLHAQLRIRAASHGCRSRR